MPHCILSFRKFDYLSDHYIYLFIHVLHLSNTTKSGVKKTGLNLGYPMIQSNAGKLPLRRTPNRVSLTTSSPRLKPINQLCTVTRCLLLQQLSGLLMVT
jgi:hypothetical protein